MNWRCITIAPNMIFLKSVSLSLNKSPHFKIIYIYLEQLLLTREAYWTSQLFTLNPHGLNKRREFGLRTALITIVNQTVSRTLLVITIVAYLVLFCFLFLA